MKIEDRISALEYKCIQLKLNLEVSKIKSKIYEEFIEKILSELSYEKGDDYPNWFSKINKEWSKALEDHNAIVQENDLMPSNDAVSEELEKLFEETK